MTKLEPLGIEHPSKQATLESLNKLLKMVERGYKDYNELNDYGKLNQCAFLGEQFIASEKRFEGWREVLQSAVYFIENFVSDRWSPEDGSGGLKALLDIMEKDND